METDIMNLKFLDDGFAVLTLTNGENRINSKFVTDFNSALDEVEKNKNCKALITTGVGKFYCNGLDLAGLQKQTEREGDNLKKNLRKMNSRLMWFPIPTVAACNGHAFGAGAYLALAHDYIIMNSRRGWISWNEIHVKQKMGENDLGIKLSSKSIREAVTFGKRLTANEAKTLNIVDEVAEPDDLMKTAKKTALQALGKSGLDRDMLQTMKQDLYQQETTKPSSKL